MGHAAPGRGRPRQAPETTTYAIVARDAPTAVILRRGPTRYTRLLRWNLRDDSIVAGQWLVGRVDPWPCGLSPSGELLVYEARKGTRTFTAICRPPHFTALAYWEYSSPWTCGGFFPSDQAVVLGLCFDNPYTAGRFPTGFQVSDVWSYFARAGGDADALASARGGTPEANHGWSRAGGSNVFGKTNPMRPDLRLERTHQRGTGERSHALVAEPGAAEAQPARRELGLVDWADWAPDGSLLFGAEGKLFRQPLPSLADALEPPSLIADLRDQTFEGIVAPDEARQWPKSAGASRKKGRPSPRR
jgi:hypothetical protein